MTVRAVRGAIKVTEDSPSCVLDATERLVRALMLAAAIALLFVAIWAIVTHRPKVIATGVAMAGLGFLAYATSNRPSNQFVYISPYLVTLIAVSISSKRLRPPAAAGIPWRKGEQL